MLPDESRTARFVLESLVELHPNESAHFTTKFTLRVGRRAGRAGAAALTKVGASLSRYRPIPKMDDFLHIHISSENG